MYPCTNIVKYTLYSFIWTAVKSLQIINVSISTGKSKTSIYTHQYTNRLHRCIVYMSDVFIVVFFSFQNPSENTLLLCQDYEQDSNYKGIPEVDLAKNNNYKLNQKEKSKTENETLPVLCWSDRLCACPQRTPVLQGLGC